MPQQLDISCLQVYDNDTSTINDPYSVIDFSNVVGDGLISPNHIENTVNNYGIYFFL